MTSAPRVTLLSGGVGGAKLAEGLAMSSHGGQLTIIANVGDDMAFHGLHVSPDVDTLLYSLSDQVDRDQGWGLAGDSRRVLDRLSALGATDTWMTLGDLDFATHIRRTDMLRSGCRLTEIIDVLAEGYGVTTPIRVPTDDAVRTQISTDNGWLEFQEYFVRERCQPVIRDIAFAGAENAKPAPEALAALANADLLIIAPSNPLVSIGPMLAVPGFAEALRATSAHKVAVSPLIGGRTVKGPADRMLGVRGLTPDPLGLAEFYGDLVDTFVIDQSDEAIAGGLREKGFGVIADDILMRSATGKRRFAESLIPQALELSEAPCP